MKIDTNIYKIENPETTDGFLKTKQETDSFIGWKENFGFFNKCRHLIISIFKPIGRFI
jgi:hypothetical protein